VFLPEPPFPYGEFIKAGVLQQVKSVKAEQFGTIFREPCIVFAGHPSLRCGDVVHFLKLWGNNPKNTLIIYGKPFRSRS
jgi:integrator complex subunit 9